ncbi:MAG: SRPBCC family protein [Myxococcota bacterium]
MPVFSREILLAAPVRTVWDFHLRPDALRRLTPPDGSVIIDEEVPVTEGAVVTLRVRMSPLPFRMRWPSRYTRVEPLRGFVDVALGGPFPSWEHHHRFSDENGRCRVTDEVQWQTPLGALGNTVSAPFIRVMLEQQLGYRHRMLSQLFGAP